LEFFIYIIHSVALRFWGWLSPQHKRVPGIFPGGNSCCVRLTTLPPSCADCLEIWESPTPGTLRASQACKGIALILCKNKTGNVHITYHLSWMKSTNVYYVQIYWPFEYMYGLHCFILFWFMLYLLPLQQATGVSCCPWSVFQNVALTDFWAAIDMCAINEPPAATKAISGMPWS